MGVRRVIAAVAPQWASRTTASAHAFTAAFNERLKQLAALRVRHGLRPSVGWLPLIGLVEEETMRTPKNTAARSRLRPELPRNSRSATLLGLAAAWFTVVAGYGQFASARVIADSTPASIRQAKDLGPVDPATTIRLTLWLRSQNESAAMEQLVEQMYDKNSPNFHRWLSAEGFKANLAPSAADVAAVRQFALENHLTISAVGRQNL